MTVYVVQDQQWVDPANGRLKPKFDFSSAERFGKLEFLLRHGAHPFNLDSPNSPLHDLQSKLRGYDPTQDYLLLVGNPVLIGLATAVAAHYGGGDVALLQWSGAKHEYIPIQAHLVLPEASYNH